MFKLIEKNSTFQIPTTNRHLSLPFERKSRKMSTQSNRASCYKPPLTVSVANSYSATVNPALLCAVTRNMYLKAL